MTGTRIIAYDFMHVRGGAERVTLGLARHISDSTVWIHAASPETFAPEEVVHTQCLSGQPLASRPVRRAVNAALGFVQARPRFARAEAVLYSGHYSPFAATCVAGQQRAFYAHALPLPLAERARSAAFSLPMAAYRAAFRAALQRMPVRFANSIFTAAAFREEYGLEFEVLPPPCDLKRFAWIGDDGYFLSMLRQEPDKRVDLVVRAFLQLPHRQLVVASDGSEHERLRALAGDAPNIRFVRSTDPDTLAALLGRCCASICLPRAEPFGLSAVESLAAGKPVLGVDEGGLPEILAAPDTGWLLPPGPSIEQVIDAVTHIRAQDCDARRTACEAAAGAYSWNRFLARLVPAWLGSAAAPTTSTYHTA